MVASCSQIVAAFFAVVFAVWCAAVVFAVMFAESAAVWWSAAFVWSFAVIVVPSTGVIVIVAGVLGDISDRHITAIMLPVSPAALIWSTSGNERVKNSRDTGRLSGELCGIRYE
jgi:hypothetical protein